jgi:hypothetical protein
LLLFFASPESLKTQNERNYRRMVVMRKSPRIIVSMVMVLSVLFTSATLGGESLTVYATSETLGADCVGNSNASAFGGLYVSNFISPSNFGTIIQISVYLANGGTTWMRDWIKSQKQALLTKQICNQRCYQSKNIFWCGATSITN